MIAESRRPAPRRSGAAADEGGARAGEYREASAQNGADEAKIQAEARGLEKERDAHLALADRAETRHHRLTAAATLLHMAIAICTIAIIARRGWPWIGSLVLGAAGAAIAAWAYL